MGEETVNPMVIYIDGDIFTSTCQTLVNPVNVVGVMGKGLALQMKKRFPGCFSSYVSACSKKLLAPGKLLLWKGEDHWILQFPTKVDWMGPSNIQYIEAGLKKFAQTYKEKGITSAAFPMLGCGEGGLPEGQVVELYEQYLEPLDIKCEVYSLK